ncbi:lactate utilization protein [Anaerosporobacter sp.]|uniref:lactate utilization protein n=1 Tax=Anaerosporobacter sp. TaxID=1872529 RepID=UPI00286F7D2B|nr:lactate utilization protein [Anaerosporobacter sp.]
MNYTEIRKNFEKHGFITNLFAKKEEATEYLSNKLQGRAIGFGGSVTLKELGLYEALQQNNVVIWHNKVASLEIRQLASHASIYITSANAVTESGEIVNIDGTGNRVAMTSFHPETCYYIIGKNKVTKNLEQAIDRSKNVAAPLNAKRLGVKTPCAVNGDKCYHCNSPERICRITTIIERPPLGMNCEVIFIDEELGY